MQEDYGIGGSSCGFALSADGHLAMAVPRHAGTLTNAAGAFDPAVDPGYEAAVAAGAGTGGSVFCDPGGENHVGAVFLY